MALQIANQNLLQKTQIIDINALGFQKKPVFDKIQEQSVIKLKSGYTQI